MTQLELFKRSDDYNPEIQTLAWGLAATASYIERYPRVSSVKRYLGELKETVRVLGSIAEHEQ